MEKHTHQFLFSRVHGIREQRLAFQQAPSPEAQNPEPQTPEKIADSNRNPDSIDTPKNVADRAQSAEKKAEEDMGSRKQAIEDVQQNVKNLEEQLRSVEGIEGEDSTTAAELRDQIASKRQDLKTLKPSEKPATDAVETGGGAVGDVTEGAATGGLEDPNKAGEKPKPNAPETKEAGNTHLDRLMGNFDSAVKEHDDAEAKAAEVRQKLKNDPKNPELQKELKQHEMEKIKAVMKAFATFFEGLKRLFNGTLFESSKGDGKGSESGTQKPAEGVANKPAAATTPEQQVKNELAKNNPKSAAETQAALGEIRENADNKIKENTKSIESLDKRIDGIKKENDVLIGKKGEVEKELNKLQGEEGKEDQILELKTELDRLNTIIEANQKAIKTLDDRRDALTKENKDLTAKRDAAEKMGEDMEKGMEKLLPMIQKLAEMLGLKLQDLNIGYNGQPIIVINNFNGNNIPVATALEAMGAKQNPETQTVEISAEQAPQASEKVSERLELWRQDIQDRMDRHGYDVVVALNEDKTSFVLRTSADTKDAMKDLKTVEGFAQKRGMQPANMQDGGLALNIDRYIQKEGYFGPAFSEESLKIEQVQDDNFAAQSSEGGTNGLGPGYPEELLEGTYEQGKAAPQVASVEQPTRNSDLGPGYPEEVLEGTYGQAQKNVEVAQEDNLGPGYDASMLEGTDGRKIS